MSAAPGPPSGPGPPAGPGGPTLTVPHRFRGPSRSGNGGWTAGALAGALPVAPVGSPAVRVRLSAPPPLDVPMAVVPGPGPSAAATLDGRAVLTATAVGAHEADPATEPVPGVSFADAVAAGELYAGRAGHPFPECFACGPRRAAGDGLRLRPGPPPGRDGLVAAAWIPEEVDAGPDGTVDPRVVWAALDCPGGWSVDIVGRPMVLGTMTARIGRAPRAGERCVVTGRALRREDRKALTATTLYGQDGGVLAVAAHVWVAVDPRAFQGDSSGGDRDHA